jgi:hypothetical protein
VPRGKAFLLRDIKAAHYPDQREYPDFEKNRRWEEHDAVQVTAKGIVFKIRERYAYFDKVKQEWDVSMAVDLTPRRHNTDRANQMRLEEGGKKVDRFWRHLPRRLQAKLMVYGFVPFEDMLIIDDKGDPEYTDPHVFIDFGPNGPFRYSAANLVEHGAVIHGAEVEKLKRISAFPSKFPEPAKGDIHDLETLNLNGDAKRNVEYLRGAGTLFSFDGRLKSLSEGSLIRIPKKDENSSEHYAEVTHAFETTTGALLGQEQSGFYRSQLRDSAGREITDADAVMVYEIYAVMLPFEGNCLTYLDQSVGW